MILLNPDIIKINERKLKEIDIKNKSIYRTVTFHKKTSSKYLLDSFINSTNNLAELLSIKNAQMEAQDEEEAKYYLKNLNKAILFLINEIKNDITFEKQVQLFQLLRIISPEAHQSHPNRFRDTSVQIGSYICPDPGEISGLVTQLFDSVKTIAHPVIKAIYFHHELIRIHPFVDGNGRITRIAKNWILMFELYPPIFIKDDVEKKEYIQSLNNSFKAIEKNNTIWHEETYLFFEQELNRIMNNIILILENLKNIDRPLTTL